MPRLVELYAKHNAQRRSFEVVAFHDESAKDFAELDGKIAHLERSVWKGKLPFPILLDSTGDTLRRYAIRAFPTEFLIDPDGRLVRGGGDRALEEILKTESQPAIAPSLSANGKTLAARTTAGAVGLLDSGTGTELAALKPDGQKNGALALSSDAKLLASVSADHAIKVMDVASVAVLASLTGHTSRVFGLSFSADGAHLVSAGFDRLRLWDLKAGKEHPALAEQRSPYWSVAFAPKESAFAAGGLGVVRVFDARTGKLRTEFKTDTATPIWSVAFSPDGKRLAATVGNDVCVWQSSGGKPPVVFKSEVGAPIALAFSSDGRELASIGRGQTARFWKLTTNKESSTTPATLKRVAALIADALPPDPAALRAESWATVVNPRNEPSDYAHALEQATSASKLESSHPDMARILGAAYYRTGDAKRAIETLAPYCDRPPAAAARESENFAGAFAFLTLAQVRAGALESSAEGIARLWGINAGGKTPDADLLDELHRAFFGSDYKEARALVDALFGKHKKSAAVILALDADASLRSGMRETAIKLAPFVAAELAVDRLFDAAVVKALVLERLDKDADISPRVRVLARRMASERQDDADSLNTASWNVVKNAERKPEEYALALIQAETAVRLSKRDGTVDGAFVNTLGVAQYRVGKFADAVKTLDESIVLNASNPDEADPSDLAFLALAHHRIGHADRAKAELKRLRKRVDDKASEDSRSLLKEAESAIEPATAKPEEARVSPHEISANIKYVLAVAVLRGQQLDIAFVDVANRKVLGLLKGAPADARAPAWSPSGRNLALVAPHQDTLHIFASGDGGGFRHLSEGGVHERHPTWAQTGKIAFESSRTGNYEIFVMHADGSNPTNISNNDQLNLDPALSPDGMRLAFAASTGNALHLTIANADGSDRRPLIPNAFIGWIYPSWSADGKQIAFSGVGLNRTAAEIYIVDADGKNLQQITSGRGTNMFASLSPDRRYLAYAHYPSARSGGRLVIVDIASKSQQEFPEIGELPWDEAHSAWRPFMSAAESANK